MSFFRRSRTTYTKRFSLEPPMGSLLCTWLVLTASAKAYMTNSRATSRGKCGDERPLMVSMLELSWPTEGISVRAGAGWR